MNYLAGTIMVKHHQMKESDQRAFEYTIALLQSHEFSKVFQDGLGGLKEIFNQINLCCKVCLPKTYWHFVSSHNYKEENWFNTGHLCDSLDHQLFHNWNKRGIIDYGYFYAWGKGITH